jgi:hypothetical protein
MFFNIFAVIMVVVVEKQTTSPGQLAASLVKKDK